jgi:very-short-patch-repair endonuclease
MGKRIAASSHSSPTKARALRRGSTEAEKRIWTLVRNNRLGVKFRRQVPIGPYSVDFLCCSTNLVVELDGSQHYTPEGREYDLHRDEFLNAYGLRVLRFSNKEFFVNQDGVMLRIWEHVHGNEPSLSPSLLGRWIRPHLSLKLEA